MKILKKKKMTFCKGTERAGKLKCLIAYFSLQPNMKPTTEFADISA